MTALGLVRIRKSSAAGDDSGNRAAAAGPLRVRLVRLANLRRTAFPVSLGTSLSAGFHVKIKEAGGTRRRCERTGKTTEEEQRRKRVDASFIYSFICSFIYLFIFTAERFCLQEVCADVPASVISGRDV